MRPLGIRGLSVTMPHKEDVISACDELTKSARRLNAVNHLTNSDGVIVGNNTDGDGFVLGFEHVTGEQIEGRRIAVFGSGGAARAIIEACARAGASGVDVIARSPERASVAAVLAGPAGRVTSVDALSNADVAVNATPVGMLETAAADAVPFEVGALSSSAIVVDIVYNPLETRLLANARRRGLRVVDGLAMLAGQASAQFATWTGVEPPLAVMMAAAHD